MLDWKKIPTSGGSVGAVGVGAVAPQPMDTASPYTIAPGIAHLISHCLGGVAHGIICNPTRSD